MAEEITRIHYRWGLTKDTRDLGALTALEMWGPRIPDEIRDAVDREGVLDLGGTRGNRALGSPIEVDELILDTPSRQVRIEVFNRGIGVISSDDEPLTRIHRVCCMLQQLLPPRETRLQVARL